MSFEDEQDIHDKRIQNTVDRTLKLLRDMKEVSDQH